MAYIYDIQKNILYMMTLKTTQKYRNIRHNPQVSVLVDTRSHPFDGFFAYGWGSEVTSFLLFKPFLFCCQLNGRVNGDGTAVANDQGIDVNFLNLRTGKPKLTQMN